MSEAPIRLLMTLMLPVIRALPIGMTIMKLHPHLKTIVMKKVFFIIICLTIIANENMYGQDRPYLELAQSTIVTFKCSITAENYKFYGLSSQDALEKIEIGEAILHSAVTLNDLRKYDEGQDPNEIVNEMGYVTVPLTRQEGNGLETFVLLNKREGKYQSTGIGDDSYSKGFLELQSSSDTGKDMKLIRVPGLNVAYAGIEIDGVLNLIAITDRDQKGNEPRPASEVFLELAKLIVDGEDVPH